MLLFLSNRVISCLILIALFVPSWVVHAASKTTIGSLVVDGYEPSFDQKVSAALAPYLDIKRINFAGYQPDGSGVLALAQLGETVQLYQIAKALGPLEGLTNEREPIAGVVASGRADDLVVLFLKDVGGSEDHQIFSFDTKTKKLKQLTDSKARHGALLWLHHGRRFLYTSNERNGKDRDVWLYDLMTGKKQLLLAQEGSYAAVAVSPDDTKVLVRRYISSTRSEVYLLDMKNPASVVVKPFLPQTEEVSFGEFAFSGESDRIYFTWDKGEEFRSLMIYDLKTGAVKPADFRPGADIENLVISKDGSQIALVVNREGYSDVHLMDGKSLLVRQLTAVPKGVLGRIEFNPKDADELAFSVASARSPSDIFKLKISTSALTQWSNMKVEGLDLSQFVSETLVRFPTFDQVPGSSAKRTIPAFVYKPKTASKTQRAPVLVYIHGGPEGQFRPGFISSFQHLVNELGMAVIAPNVRGSDGYGKGYLKLDNGYLREDSVKDIGALLDFIAGEEDLDPSKVVVSGGSYGGYMVLASMAHYGDRLLGGIDRVGISHFVTFLTNTRDYRRDLRRVEYGDERDPKMKAFLERISPLNQAHRIRKPLFIYQGLNDPRVPVTEAEQMVQTIRKQGGQVWYLLAKDEGHGLKKRSNRDFYQESSVKFLRNLLGLGKS